mgnify:CR=1 FL=1
MKQVELLSMVRKHSKFLAKPSADEDDASDVEMDIHFWHDVLNVYFVSGKESRGRQEDDMLFFVRKVVFCYSYDAWFIFLVPKVELHVPCGEI